MDSPRERSSASVVKERSPPDSSLTLVDSVVSSLASFCTLRLSCFCLKSNFRAPPEPRCSRML